MSNPPPVKVSSKPTAAATTNDLPTPQFPGVSVSIPTAPTYQFANTKAPDLHIASATFNYDTQHPNVVKYLRDQISFGFVEYTVIALYNQVVVDNLIRPLEANDPKLAANPPNVTVTWSDKTGSHTKTFGMNDTIVMGSLNAWGKFMKKPGELSWEAASVAGRLQFWLTLAAFWMLVVVWSYKMWGHLGDSGLTWTTATNNAKRFGDYGVWFAIAAGLIAPFGLTRYVMAFASALAPIWGFCFQFAIWFFVDSQITRPLDV